MPRAFAAISYLQGSPGGSFGGSPTGATLNGNGQTIDVLGAESAQQLEVQETAGGTATLTLQGSFDGNTWYAAGYQQVDGIAAPTRSIAPIAIAANAKHVYQILDPYPQLQAVLSAVAGGATVIARVYQIGS